MGIGMGYRSSSSFDKPKNEVSRSVLCRGVSKSVLCRGVSKIAFDNKKLPNPDPSNYRILKHVQIGEYLLLELRYPDCTNYEGKKVLLFKSTYRELEKQGVIDPHFSDSREFISPIARFEPTIEGWRWGKELAKKLDGERVKEVIKKEVVVYKEKEIIEVIVSLLKNYDREITVDKVKNSRDLIKDLGLDSLDVCELVLNTEDHFDITFDEDSAKFTKLEDILKYIKKCIEFRSRE